jgi:hypothetical protein
VRSHSKKEFVYAAMRYEIAEKSGATLVEQVLYGELVTQEFQDRLRIYPAV